MHRVHLDHGKTTLLLLPVAPCVQNRQLLASKVPLMKINVCCVQTTLPTAVARALLISLTLVTTHPNGVAFLEYGVQSARRPVLVTPNVPVLDMAHATMAPKEQEPARVIFSGVLALLTAVGL